LVTTPFFMPDSLLHC